MTTTTRPARDTAIARMNEQQDQAVAAAQEQRARPSALGNIANRLGISQAKLQETLMSTVFKGANANEFAALVVVADAYNLNPLLKEIYAFPQKGGGIVPLVSIDGWVRIMNEHPQFDGIEFADIADANGKLYAIEATIYRKDRTRPVKIIEYLEECKGNSAPWAKSPARMLRHRALIQCARYAFGFSGIAVEGEVDEHRLEPLRDVTPMPTREMIANGARAGDGERQAASEPDEADLAAAREVARQDAGADDDGVIIDDDQGDAPEVSDTSIMRGIADSLIQRIGRAETVIAVKNLKAQINPDMPDEFIAEVNAAADERDAELRKPR